MSWAIAGKFALRYLPHLLIVAAIIGAVAWIDHRGYQRAQADVKFERAVTAGLIESRVAAMESNLVQAISLRGEELAETESAIEDVRRTIQPTIQKELTNAPHLSDPAAGYGRSLQDAINAAIDQSAGAAAASGSDR